MEVRRFVLLALVVGVGCSGYRNDSLFPRGARLVAVPIFENDTFFRQVEFDLTRSVCDQIRMRPGIHVVDRGQADLVLEGRVTRIDQDVLSIANRNRATEQAATTVVSVRVLDGRTGEVLKTFTESERVNFAVGTGEGLQTAQKETFYELARKIVYELESDW